MGELSATSMSGAEVDFCTVTPALITSCGSCEVAWETRICARIWSMFGSVVMSKFTVIRIDPLALTDWM